MSLQLQAAIDAAIAMFQDDPSAQNLLVLESVYSGFADVNSILDQVINKCF